MEARLSRQAGMEAARLRVFSSLTNLLMRLFRAPGLLLLVCLGACTGNQAEQVDLQIDNGGIDLAVSLAGDWDRVCVIGPYSVNHHAAEITGFQVDIEAQSKIEASDSIALLITIAGEKVADLYEVRRGNIDFTGLAGRCFARADARFSVPAPGWPHAEPAGSVVLPDA